MADQQETIPTAESSAHRLTVLYIIALSAVAVLTIVGQILIQHSLQRQLGDSSVVNVAGRQRMLSQKITKLALQIGTGQIDVLQPGPSQTNQRQELQETLDLWRASHRDLQDGNTKLGLPGSNSPQVHSLYAAIEPDFQAILAAGNLLLKRPPGPADDGQADDDGQPDDTAKPLETILRHEPAFLVGMDQIVQAYDQEAADRVARLKRIERALLFITLSVLLLEGLFIFRPAVAQIRKMVHRLRDNAVDLNLAKEAAECANLEKTRFLAKMSHELRTPMNAILGLSEVLLRSRLQPGQRKLIGTIHDSAESLMSLLTDLLDMSKLEVDTSLKLRRAHMNVSRTLTKVHEMFVHQAQQRGLELRLDLADDLDRTVLGDESRLRQVFVNLIQNALKFTEAGTVTIEAGVQKTMAHELQVNFCVRDTGPGIAPADQATIFEPFVQATAHRGKHGGAGLGLSIASRLVEAMRGRIRVVSRLGEGTIFVLEIPFEIPFPESPASAAGTSPLRSHGSLSPLGPQADILIVEDVAANRLVIGTMLGEWEIVPRYAETLAEAFAQLDASWPDIIFLDLELPDGDGFEFFAELVRRCQAAGVERPQVIALTAHATDEVQKRTEAAGIDQFLTKPLTIEGIHAALEQLPAPTAAGARQSAASFHSFDPSVSPLDQDEIDPLEEYPPELRLQLRGIYTDSYLSYYEAMVTAWHESDRRQFVFQAHRLLGLAANLGASPALGILRQLDDDRIDLSNPALEAQIDQLREHLDDLAEQVTRRA